MYVSLYWLDCLHFRFSREAILFHYLCIWIWIDGDLSSGVSEPCTQKLLPNFNYIISKFDPSRVVFFEAETDVTLVTESTCQMAKHCIALSKLLCIPLLKNVSCLGLTNIKYIPTSPILISFMMRQRHLWSCQYGQDLWNLEYKGVIDLLDFDRNS